jgi:hypothetical protein
MNSLLATRKNHRGNPIARAPGSIDVNTRIDSKFLRKSKTANGHARMGEPLPILNNTNVEDGVYDVVEGEVLMARRQGQARRKRSGALAFSSANGLPNNPDFLNDLVYAGVATTAYKASTDGCREEQGFVATYAGLCTMMNSGSATIYPGDLLRVTMPKDDRNKRAVDGTCAGKIVFGLEPCNKSNYDEVIQDALIQDLMRDAGGDFATEALVMQVVKKMEDLRRFEIGRAMGYAAKGFAVDVCLG